MGADHGVGRWTEHERATLVEDCQLLAIGKLLRAGVLCHPSGRLYYRQGTGQVSLGVAEWRADTDEPGSAMMLEFPADFGRAAARHEQRIRFTTTGAGQGGRRLAFVCPAGRHPTCRARGGVARTLYLPPGHTRFACRWCGALTYRRTQLGPNKADEEDALYAEMNGVTLEEARARHRERGWGV